jgi:hypothetical protein
MPGFAEECLVSSAFPFESIVARELDEAIDLRAPARRLRVFVEFDE